MKTIPLIITAYIVCGIIFMTLIDESQPEKIKNNKIFRSIMGILSVISWIPWLLLNSCFSKRDIWFRRKTV